VLPYQTGSPGGTAHRATFLFVEESQECDKVESQPKERSGSIPTKKSSSCCEGISVELALEGHHQSEVPDT
jgi:hypothetical protein